MWDSTLKNSLKCRWIISVTPHLKDIFFQNTSNKVFFFKTQFFHENFKMNFSFLDLNFFMKIQHSVFLLKAQFPHEHSILSFLFRNSFFSWKFKIKFFFDARFSHENLTQIICKYLNIMKCSTIKNVHDIMVESTIAWNIFVSKIVWWTQQLNLFQNIIYRFDSIF